MNDTDYLMKFRRCSSEDTLERLYDKLNYSLGDNKALANMYRAADHRRAELVTGKLFDFGKIPKAVWSRVK